MELWYGINKKNFAKINAYKIQCVTKKTGFFNFLYKYLFKLYKILKIYVNFWYEQLYLRLYDHLFY